MPLAPVLFIVFLVLKLTGVIAWSWLWVTAPLWIPFVIVLVLALFGVSLFGIGARRMQKRHDEAVRRMRSRRFP